LLYARFFTKAVRDLGLTKADEPFTSLLTQGMVTKETYRCEIHAWLFPTDLIGSDKEGWKCKHCGRPAERGRVEKMSKSKKNIVDPEHLVGAYGADTARLFSLFAAPPEKDLEWSDAGVEGAYRFLGRVWRLVEGVQGIFEAKLQTQDNLGQQKEMTSTELRRLTHRTIKKVTEDIDREFQFNTAVAALMEFVNGLYKFQADTKGTENGAFREAIETLLKLLSPFAPHLAEELWARTGHTEMLVHHRWPTHEEALTKADVLTIPVQVNGKLRSKLLVPADWTMEQILDASLADAKVGEWVKGKTIKKKVYVEKRLVNIVVEG